MSILEVTIHSKLAVKILQVPALNLWYYLRALDCKGSGRIEIDVNKLLGRLGVSRATLYRYLNNEDLFRTYKSRKGILTIYLVSLPKVCRALDISNLGAIGYGDANDDIVEQAIGIQAQTLQNQSFYLANQANKVSSTTGFNYPNPRKKDRGVKNLKLKATYNPLAAKYPIVNPVDCFFDEDGKAISPSAISPGVNDGAYIPIASAHKLKTPAGVREAVIHYKDNQGQDKPYWYLEASSYVMPWGGSQKGIAKRLDISVATVKRYLANHTKVRLAYKTTWHEYLRHKFEASENFGVPLEEGYIVSQNGKDVFKWGTNIYYPLYSLTSGKYIKAKVNALLSSI